MSSRKASFDSPYQPNTAQSPTQPRVLANSPVNSTQSLCSEPTMSSGRRTRIAIIGDVVSTVMIELAGLNKEMDSCGKCF
jgi:hypothetical protein